ncbi:putative glutathione-specific gamma-glutamylcyclotransferase 2 [Erysiphe neolycopersici]|uniref:glutathione-specific gamma-glutamylcyclotransferase n=1 Tax=Erysiphe neolycopersici TaxID=212602 RepID=A0A420HQT3_9PEZI|nr:putative glutathione-specific gamma-glutamylcyclotransferase 2 [Erysiphe neolycopersici]
MASLIMDDESEFWLFGYGEDHRGTPENPGRVVTLIERLYWNTLDETQSLQDDKVWGVAYRIKAPRVTEVREYLDIREINGYSIHQTLFHSKEVGKSMRVFVYIGTPSNPQFTGPQQPDLLAEIIHKSIGPSGSNIEYLFCLEEALDRLNPPLSRDAHVTQLANLIRQL